jgi:hypothetical protein
LSVRENYAREGSNPQLDGQQIHQDIINEDIRTSKPENINQFTEKVGNYQVSAEGQPQCHERMKQGSQDTNEE